MDKITHKMKLRTRKSMGSELPVGGRAALGDISNKRSAPGSKKKVSVAKKLKTATVSVEKDISQDPPICASKDLNVEEDEFLKDPPLVPHQYRLVRKDFDGINHTEGVAPHDMRDIDDELKISSYVSDLFQHLYSAEAKYAPSTYMDKQADINSRMRAILVDWLVEVHMKFRLVPETLYLCINVIDRYCSLVCVPRSKLQLVGVTALLISCKYEEIYPPEVRDCVYITDRAYQREEVLAMEQSILEKLRFDITVPTAYPFLLRYQNIVMTSRQTRYVSHYYMERTLQEHDMLKFKPSLVAAAAVILALNNCEVARAANNGNVIGFPLIILEYTGFSKEELYKCAVLIARKVGEEPVTASRRQLVAVKRKYDSSRYENVSSRLGLPTAEMLLDFIDTDGNKHRTQRQMEIIVLD